MSVRALAILTMLAIAGCAGDAPVAPAHQITIDELPAGEVADLQQLEQSELARIEARRSNEAVSFDSLSVLWSGLKADWAQRGPLLVCAPRPYDGAARIIGPEGGTIGAGIATLRIPPGALDRPTVITVESSGTFELQAEFRPHGLQFRVRPTLTMDYEHCRRPRWTQERIAYLGDQDEVLEWPDSRDRSDVDLVDATIGHFSRYAVAF